MFAVKFTTVLLSLFFVSSSVLAQPPACLLAAVNTEPNPADLGTICGPDALKVQKVIANICGANDLAAQSAFSSTCSVAGKTVSLYTATGTAAGSFTATATGTITGLPGTATKSGSSSTGAAAPQARAADVGSFAAAVVAVAGVVAVL